MMLRELHIKNISIIDDVTIEFHEGFNVLTGETGAGKSIIINALSLALGERAAGEIIRSGEKEAVIEAFFDVSSDVLSPSNQKFLQDNGIDAGDGLIFKRMISAQGRNRAYINSSMVNLQTLSDVSSNIIDIHGQYDHQSLLSPEHQLDLLDAFGGLLSEREEVKSIFERQHAVKEKIAGLLLKDRERAQRLDMLRFQMDEIEAAGLSPDEEEELTGELKVLSSAVHLTELAANAYESLYSAESSCMVTFSKILDAIREISTIDSSVKENLRSAEDALPLLEETGYFLRDYKNSMDFRPERLDEIQNRLEIIRGLKRKYGGSVQEVIDYWDKAVIEIEELQDSEEKLEGFNNELEELKGRLTDSARKLSEKRKSVAGKIESKVEAQLAELSMPDTRFSIQITHEKGDDTKDGLKAAPTGIDNIEFLISPNVGEELRPLAKTASGGELSRIMLALKVILAKGDSMPVLVFDEIDTGVGGRAAETMGQKLKALSSGHQVICITHLPQIASHAEEHLRIEKMVENKRTKVRIARIEKHERTEEIARMLGGKISSASMKHAKEMLGKGH